MVRTGNIDFSCKRLTSIEIWKSKYHIIRRVRFRWDPPPPPPPRERYLIRAWRCPEMQTSSKYDVLNNFYRNVRLLKIAFFLNIDQDYISMGESNTVVNAFTTCRHLRQYCSHPFICSDPSIYKNM